MAFPVTLNGRTYTLADFEGTNYVDGLPDAFEDFVTQAGDIYNSTSTSSVAIGTGSKTFTTADSGKPYQAGTPLRIADAAAPETNFMDAIVTSYSGTTLVVDVFGFAGSGTKSNWTINIGGAKTVDGTLAVAQGGTGATSASGARTNLGLGTIATQDADSVDIDGGAIDGVTIGGASAAAGTFTTFTSTGIDDNATSTAITIDTSENVGIGVSPSAKLDVLAGADQRIRFSTVGSDPVISAVNGANTDYAALKMNGDTFQFAARGNTSNSLNVDASGNVGIGTSGPATVKGGKVLALSNATGTEFIAFRNDTLIADGDFVGGYIFGNNDSSGSPNHYGGMWATADDAFGSIKLNFATNRSSYENNTPELVIDSDGNVGIGTSSPASILHLQESGTSTDAKLRIAGTNANGDASNIIEIGATQVVNNTSSAMTFATRSTGTLAERMRIDSSGNVGVGTSSPQKPLHISGPSGGDAGISFTNSISGESSTDGLLVTLNSDGTNATFWNYENGYMRFATNSTERMRIDSSGNLLVGATSAPGVRGAFVSSTNQHALKGVTSTAAYASLVCDNEAASGTRFFTSFRINNSIVGNITSTGSTTVYGTTSDYRLKENVVTLDNATDRLKQIPVHRFNFIASPDNTVDGFLAHEVQAVVPEAIHGTKDEVDDEGNPVYQGIDQSKLVPLLTAALQEAVTRIETLEAEVAALKGA